MKNLLIVDAMGAPIVCRISLPNTGLKVLIMILDIPLPALKFCVSR